MKRALYVLTAVMLMAGIEASCPKGPPPPPPIDIHLGTVDLNDMNNHTTKVGEILGPDAFYVYVNEMNAVPDEQQENIWKATDQLVDRNPSIRRKGLKLMLEQGKYGLRRLGRLANYSADLDVRLIAIEGIEKIAAKEAGMKIPAAMMLVPLVTEKQQGIRNRVHEALKANSGARVFITEFARGLTVEDSKIARAVGKLYLSQLPEDLRKVWKEVFGISDAFDVKTMLRSRKQLEKFTKKLAAEKISLGPDSWRYFLHMLSLGDQADVEGFRKLAPKPPTNGAIPTSRKLSSMLTLEPSAIASEGEFLAKALNHEDPGVQLEAFEVLHRGPSQDLIPMMIDKGMPSPNWILYDRTDRLIADLTFQYAVWVNPLAGIKVLDDNRETWRSWWKGQRDTGSIKLPEDTAEGWREYKTKLVHKVKLTDEEKSIQRNVDATEVELNRVEDKFKEITRAVHGRRDAKRYFAKVDGVRIEIIDNSRNGFFNDFGNDKIHVSGEDAWGSFLSPIIRFKKDLWHFRCEADGSKIYLMPYKGARGKIRVKTQYGKGVELSIVKFSRGPFWFASEPVKKGDRLVEVPVGSYELATGMVRRFNQSGGTWDTAVLSMGHSKAVEVAEGQTVDFSIGFPFEPFFPLIPKVREDKTVDLEVGFPNVYGVSREIYSTFIEDKFNFKIEWYDAKTDKKLGNGDWARNEEQRQEINLGSGPDQITIDLRLQKQGWSPYVIKGIDKMARVWAKKNKEDELRLKVKIEGAIPQLGPFKVEQEFTIKAGPTN